VLTHAIAPNLKERLGRTMARAAPAREEFVGRPRRAVSKRRVTTGLIACDRTMAAGAIREPHRGGKPQRSGQEIDKCNLQTLLVAAAAAPGVAIGCPDESRSRQLASARRKNASAHVDFRFTCRAEI
jgi:hypothetical protein